MGNPFCYTDRDTAILIFLWRWRLATTSTLHAVICGAYSPYSTSKAMERLGAHKVVESRVDHFTRMSYWQLTKKGYESIRCSLGPLQEDVWASRHPARDLHTLAFQLGAWSAYPEAKVQFFTAQELQCYARGDYPEWVKLAAGEGPSGLTRLQLPDKEWRLASQVELLSRRPSDYEAQLLCPARKAHIPGDSLIKPFYAALDRPKGFEDSCLKY